ncbi:hypothetical protein [Pseudonocardia parietis]|uniref:Uncharacterized protein n=1 Tax=Pseudonocardia parietis TaxID=570936 RepID=A0ABS4W5Q1_9PSEU|nr:hypothetical protein [Pseudonocardia parietis]MBP2371537.1 hypothetical protein [Pseudonocardia parietis]
MDRQRATRKLTRYLGSDIDTWSERFRGALTDPGARLAKLIPRRRPRIIDQSFR